MRKIGLERGAPDLNASAPVPTRAIMSAAVLCLLSGGCAKEEPPDPTPPPSASEPRILALNELPPGQLRVFLKGFPGDWRGDSPRSKGIAEPAAQKPVSADAKRIDLPPAEELASGTRPLREVIAARRSVRTFSSAPLSLDELSYLLWSTQGITGVTRDESGEVAHRFRAAPSGGGRYPLETYLVVNRVGELAAGLYRYLPVEHQLLLLRESPDVTSELRAACYGQEFVEGAAVAFVWAAVPERTEWKYAYLAARMIAIEAGHICQNLYLAAGASGAGCCALLSYDQNSLDKLLGVDGQDEFAVYLACVGKPSPSEVD